MKIAPLTALLFLFGSVAEAGRRNEQHDPEEPPPAEEMSAEQLLGTAETALEEQRWDEAIMLATQAVTRGLGEDDAFAAKYLLRKAEAKVVPDATRIGVLLPLSGKYGAAGSQIRQALDLGYGTTKRYLVYVDAGETPESALAGLEKLVLEEHVVAVVGPLRTEGTAELARAAHALRIPLVGLSQTDDIAAGRDFVLQAMVTPREQVAALLDYVMGGRGFSRFAVFAPDNHYGHLAATVFRTEVEARGGAISAEAFYNAEATDLIPYAKELGHKDYETRQGELARLRAETKANGGDPTKVVLPPKLDFDALFLPDNVQRIPIACAGLAYEEFPIGEFKPTKDTKTVPLLGLSGWNNDTLVTRGGLYVRGGFFTDAHHASGETALAFDERYRIEIGRTPTALEAVAFDIGALLHVAAESVAANPREFRDALLAATLPESVTGTNGFDPTTRAARHDIRVLTITKDGIQPADDPALAPPQ